MPDFTTEYYWECETATFWETKLIGSRGDVYTVRKDRSSHLRQGEVEYDWSCTCKAYKYGGGKYCKHIRDVQESGEYCGWMQFIHGAGPIKDENGELHCPNSACGGPVVSRGWAV